MEKRKRILLWGTGRIADWLTDFFNASHHTFYTHQSNQVPAVLRNSAFDTVILANDAWDPVSERIALAAVREAGIPILPVFGRMRQVFIGPVERPRVPGCVGCLEARWLNGVQRTPLLRQIADNIELGLQVRMPLVLSEERKSSLQEAVANALRKQPDRNARSLPEVVIFHGTQANQRLVSLLPVNTCARCGPIFSAERSDHSHFCVHPQPLVSSESIRTRGSGLKGCLEAFVDPDLGYVSRTTTVWEQSGISIEAARIERRTRGTAKGWAVAHEDDEKLTAILEAAERAARDEPSVFHRTVHASYTQLCERAVHPQVLGMHGPEAYVGKSHFTEFREDKQYLWAEAYSWTAKGSKYVPEQFVHAGLLPGDGERFIVPSSSGTAVGGTLEEAVLYGILEVMERDSFLNAWYGQLRLPEFVVDRDSTPKVQNLMATIQNEGYEARLFDMTLDHNVPSILAVAVRRDSEGPKTLCTSAAHLLPHQALEHALSELLMRIVAMNETMQKDSEEWFDAVKRLGNQDTIVELEHHARVAALPECEQWWDFLLRKHSGQPLKTFEETYGGAEDRYHVESRDLSVIVRGVLDGIARRGFDLLFTDVTTLELATVGLRAACVLVPGMLPLTFGATRQRVKALPRVRELPWRLGYSARPLAVGELNPRPHPFA